MKKYNLITGLILLVSVAAITGCLKKTEILPKYDLDVSFASSGAKFVTTDLTVNPKDSLYFDFTMTSPTDMKYVLVQKNSTDITKDTLGTAQKNSFKSVKRFAADSAAGVYTYSFVAKDAAGVFLGRKNITVTVTPDFDYYTLRVLQVPDSVAKTNKSYFSATTGKTFSYAEGSGNSALIDFGYFYDTTTVTPVANAPKHTIYALNASTFLPYDLSSWTKNATIMKRITSPTFVNITSKGILRTAGIANLSSGATSKITSAGTTNGNLTGVVIIFRTAGGKYGAMNINYTSKDSPNADNFINIDVKIER